MAWQHFLPRRAYGSLELTKQWASISSSHYKKRVSNASVLRHKCPLRHPAFTPHSLLFCCSVFVAQRWIVRVRNGGVTWIITVLPWEIQIGELSNTLTNQVQADKKYDLSISAQWKSSMKQEQPYLLRRNPPMTDLLAPTILCTVTGFPAGVARRRDADSCRVTEQAYSEQDTSCFQCTCFVKLLTDLYYLTPPAGIKADHHFRRKKKKKNILIKMSITSKIDRFKGFF